MSNEELVKEIQSGNNDKKLELWHQVERLVQTVATPVIHATKNNKIYERNDLMQIGYLALENAIKSYDVNADYKFTTHFWYVLKTEFAKQTSFRTAAQKSDPTRSPISLNEPIHIKNENIYCLQDLLQDPNDYFEYIDECDYESWKKRVIEEAIQALTDEEKQVIQFRYYENKTQMEISMMMNVSYQRISQIKNTALKKLRKNPKLQELYGYVENRTDCYYRCSLSDYIRTGCSMVEKIVDFREQLQKHQDARYIKFIESYKL